MKENEKISFLGESCCPKCSNWFDYSVVLKKVENIGFVHCLKHESYVCPNCKSPYELDTDCDDPYDAILLPIFN